MLAAASRQAAQDGGLDVPRHARRARGAARRRRRRPRLGAVLPHARGRGARPGRRHRRTPPGAPPRPGTRCRRPASTSGPPGALVAELLGDRRRGRRSTHGELQRLLRCYGIDLWDALPAATAEEAVAAADRLGYPVALKATAPHLRHRRELGGVRLDIDDAEEMRGAFEAMAAAARRPGRRLRRAGDGADRGRHPARARSRTRCSARSCPSGSAASPPTCSATGRTACRRSPTPTSAAWSAAVRAAPLLLGHGGSTPGRRGRARGPAGPAGPAGRRPARGGRARAQPGGRRARPAPPSSRRPAGWPARRPAPSAAPGRSAPEPGGSSPRRGPAVQGWRHDRHLAGRPARRHRARGLLPRAGGRRGRRRGRGGGRSRRSSCTRRRPSTPRRYAGTSPCWSSRPAGWCSATPTTTRPTRSRRRRSSRPSTEAVPLSSVRSVVVNRVVTDPMRYRGGRPAAGGHRHHRLGRGQPPRPRAGRLLRPGLRGRPRLHRHGVGRRHRAAGQRGGRGRRRGRPDARLRRRAVPRHRAVTPARPPRCPTHGYGGLAGRRPARGAARRSASSDRRAAPARSSRRRCDRVVRASLVDGLGCRRTARARRRGAVPHRAARRRRGSRTHHDRSSRAPRRSR